MAVTADAMSMPDAIDTTISMTYSSVDLAGVPEHIMPKKGYSVLSTFVSVADIAHRINGTAKAWCLYMGGEHYSKRTEVEGSFNEDGFASCYTDDSDRLDLSRDATFYVRYTSEEGASHRWTKMIVVEAYGEFFELY